MPVPKVKGSRKIASAVVFAVAVFAVLGVWLSRFLDRKIVAGFEAVALLTVAYLAYGYLTMRRDIEIKRSEAYFRSLFENALELITVLDAKGIITYENPSNRNFVGYEREEMVGRNVFEVIHPDDASAVQAAFGETLRRPGASPRLEFRIRHKDRSWRWLEAFGNNLLSDAAVKGIVVNSRDITERKLADERIRELNGLRDRFITVVSHQLRTPLSGIRWNLESVLDGPGSRMPKAVKEAVTTSHENAVEVIRRINGMLTAIDVEQGRAVIRKAPASIEEAWGPVFAEWKRRCEKKGLSCRYAPPGPALPEFAFDVEKIRGAMLTLAENALQYTASGGRIDVRLTAADGAVRFEVEDTGIGVPAAEQARIFTRFYRATNAAQALPDADGVGLSIAKSFIEGHGGRIGFSSEEGRGSAFWFELPLAEKKKPAV